MFEDDPYVALRFAGTPLPTMLSMDGDAVVYASSFSKTVCPGSASATWSGPTELIARIVKLATNTYISPSMVVAGDRLPVLHLGGARALDRDRQGGAARARADALLRRCATSSPTRRFVEPEGGYFLWVDLPRGTDVGALFAAAAERGVQFVKGTDFVLEGGDSSLRLAYSGVTPAEIEEGVDRLGRGLPRGDLRRHRLSQFRRSGQSTSGRSGRGRARAARAARSAAAARGRRRPRRSRRRSR